METVMFLSRLFVSRYLSALRISSGITGRVKGKRDDVVPVTTYPVEAIKVSHDILEVLVDRGRAGVTEVATALDIPTSTADDHLRTLERVGYLVKEDRTYRLSTRLLRVGQTARNNHGLFVHGRDEALALSETTGEGTRVQLVAEENGRCAVLLTMHGQHERLPSQATRTYPTRVHLHTNAPGKAILARTDPEETGEIVTDHGLPRRTPATITDETELFAELDRVREDGYAIDDEELITGMMGVAAPVVTDTDVHGAVAVYATSDRFRDGRDRDRIVDAVRESAAEIEANLIFASD